LQEDIELRTGFTPMKTLEVKMSKFKKSP